MTDLRKQARSIENQLDAKLVQYSRLDGGSSASASGARAEATPTLLQREIEGLLSQLAETNDKMSRQAAEGGGVAASMHVLQRHREILHDFTQEFNKTKANLKVSDERSQLLSSVQNDIREARKTASGSDALLRERNALQSSNRMADDVLSQASAQLGALNDQRSTFKGIGSKLTELAALSPQMNAMINFVSRRKKREKLILGAVIGMCSASILLYSFG